MNWMLKLQERVSGLAPWDAKMITDEWFRAHFDYAADVVHHWIGGVLDVRKATFLNFGCGDGITDLSLVLRYGATAIHGVDIRREYAKLPRIAREQLGMSRIPSALTFETIKPSSSLAGRRPLVDGIMSWSTFEHVQRDQLAPILADLHACLKPGGYFFIQIEPLFYSPYGSHLRRYDEMPWHHLLATEDELWKIIHEHAGPIDASEVDFGFADFGPDGYKRFVFKEYQALNRLTADELVGFALGAGFRVERQERRNVEMDVPTTLLERYPREWLVNNEIFLLLRKD
ncbi:MAG: class I SAM-dependent methyltransferase [Gammaproteobacteria bacterium]|nr:class I SAM-dependent methyltransferase [Gammaproteobacteria bacterium]MBU1506999.1 class I SAM-dependent methyltransferase [Gammaproteobacteria bacterium]MBU2121799.1 class I SAM-dependent methyltransferase [Gammaproteobacteria bacterium]MBU2172818.1 class I SAM-dependent methyltransferase [Gammaproteobacteria bacterium]MBU2200678.1 class I SAM-dependent methyltransferase [Gammaproteobacteria bacterium]